MTRCRQPIALHGSPSWYRGVLARLALATLAAGCGGGDLVVPDTDNAAAIRVVEGDGQRGSGDAGMSSNIMSLAGIAIAIGVLVDAGIVVTENAFRRVEQRGVDPRNRLGVWAAVRSDG